MASIHIRNDRVGVTRAVTGVIRRQGIYDQLGKIDIPTLIIVGEHDITTAPKKSERMHAKIPNSKLVTILGKMEQTARTQDPLNVTPGTHKLAFENDRVRIFDVNIKPGGKVAMHSHPGYVAIVLDKKCKVKFTSPDGKEEQAEFKAGDTIWREAESHSVQNIGSTQCHVLHIELKESAKIS